MLLPLDDSDVVLSTKAVFIGVFLYGPFQIMQWSQWKPLKSIFLGFPIHNLHYLLEHFGVLDVDFPLLQILVLVPIGDVREGPRG